MQCHAFRYLCPLKYLEWLFRPLGYGEERLSEKNRCGVSGLFWEVIYRSMGHGNHMTFEPHVPCRSQEAGLRIVKRKGAQGMKLMRVRVYET